MDTPNVERLLDDFINEMFSKWRMYGGGMATDGMKKLVNKEVDQVSAKAVVPYWFPVFEKGRGVRKSNVYQEFDKRIYEWMQKKNLFKSKTEKGKINEAKSLAWYINKYGNKHFRSKQFIDVYTNLIPKYADKAAKKYGDWAVTVASDLIKV